MARIPHGRTAPTHEHDGPGKNRTQIYEAAMKRALKKHDAFSHMVYYDQRTGKVYHNSEVIGRAVSGNGTGLMNPDAQNIAFAGPVPRNIYPFGIRGVSDRPGVGYRLAMHQPLYNELMFGRNEMAWHAGGLRGALGSQGCITFDSLDQFNKFLAHADKAKADVIQVFDSGRFPKTWKFNPSDVALDLEKELKTRGGKPSQINKDLANWPGIKFKAAQNPLLIAPKEIARLKAEKEKADRIRIAKEKERRLQQQQLPATAPAPAPDEKTPEAKKTEGWSVMGTLKRIAGAIGDAYTKDAEAKRALIKALFGKNTDTVTKPNPPGTETRQTATLSKPNAPQGPRAAPLLDISKLEGKGHEAEIKALQKQLGVFVSGKLDDATRKAYKAKSAAAQPTAKAN